MLISPCRIATVVLLGLSGAAVAELASLTVNSPVAPLGATANAIVTFANSTTPDASAAGFEFRFSFDSTRLSVGMPTSNIAGLFCALSGPGVVNCLGVDPKDDLPASGFVAFPMTVIATQNGTSPLQVSEFTWSDGALNEFGPSDPTDGLFTFGSHIIFVDGFE